MSDEIPVEIKIWLPGHMPTTFRGTLTTLEAQNSIALQRYDPTHAPRLSALTGPLKITIDRRWWWFNKHREPKIGGKNRG